MLQMTDAQRDELERLRMKAASPEMVTVPRALLAAVLCDAVANSQGFADLAKVLCDEVANSQGFAEIAAEYSPTRSRLRRTEAAELARIAELRAIAGIE